MFDRSDEMRIEKMKRGEDEERRLRLRFQLADIAEN